MVLLMFAYRNEDGVVMKVLALSVLVFALALVSNMDHQDALTAEDHYCEMVKAENWPNYRDDIDCSK